MVNTITKLLYKDLMSNQNKFTTFWYIYFPNYIFLVVLGVQQLYEGNSIEGYIASLYVAYMFGFLTPFDMMTFNYYKTSRHSDFNVKHNAIFVLEDEFGNVTWKVKSDHYNPITDSLSSKSPQGFKLLVITTKLLSSWESMKKYNKDNELDRLTLATVNLLVSYAELRFKSKKTKTRPKLKVVK